MPNIATRIADALQKHNIDLLRFEAGARQEIEAVFKALGVDLIKRIERHAPVGVANLNLRNRRLGVLFRVSGEDIDAAYNELSKIEGKQKANIARMESREAAAFVNSTLNVDLVSGQLTAERLQAIANDTLIEGAPSREWWSKQKRGTRDAFRFQIRQALFGNETIQDMVRRVRGRRENRFRDGILATSTRNAQALVRSSALAVANKAREATFQANDDVIKGQQWLSTLDSRTTDICKALDGEAWFLDGRRMPGTKLNYRGPPPAHWNCRSTLVPVLRSWSELTKNPKIRRKLRAAEDRLPAGIRASMDGAVSEKLDYEAWLKTKDEQFQIEVLGPTKHRLWKSGKLSFADFVDQSHNPLSVAELQERAK